MGQLLSGAHDVPKVAKLKLDTQVKQILLILITKHYMWDLTDLLELLLFMHRLKVVVLCFNGTSGP